MANSPSLTAIDLSQIPPPAAIEPLSFETLYEAFKAAFLAFWAEAQAKDPTLPDYNVEMLEVDPAAIIGQAWSYIRLLDRARVNDAVRAVLAPLAKGTDLDNIAARQGVLRLETAPGVPETDEQLLKRYLLSFGRASAGSIDRILFDAYTAWPGMWDARVNGWAVHGRRGEIDLVISGPAGVTPPEQLATVRAAVTSSSAKPEAIGMFVLAAVPLNYAVVQAITVPVGPDPDLLQEEAVSRVTSTTDARHLIGGTVKRDLVAGAAYGASIVSVSHSSPPADVVATPYQIPVRTGVEIAFEVSG
ncbi:MAG: baseplate assembly protein [Chelatococcus sp.]|nr:MAG: baseplate assembly protein [Chelatococcus sp.]